jgi:hypothetical protein
VLNLRCGTHDIPLIVEEGGPDQSTIQGRTYCPKCQEAFNAALDSTNTNEA